MRACVDSPCGPECPAFTIPKPLPQVTWTSGVIAVGSNATGGRCDLAARAAANLTAFFENGVTLRRSSDGVWSCDGHAAIAQCGVLVMEGGDSASLSTDSHDGPPSAWARPISVGASTVTITRRLPRELALAGNGSVLIDSWDDAGCGVQRRLPLPHLLIGPLSAGNGW